MFNVSPSEYDRPAWLRTLTCANPNHLAELLDPLLESLQLRTNELRAPEIGLELVAARVGATGEPFGLGEVTVTRCVIQIEDRVGVGYVRGRAPLTSRRIAIADALLQGTHHEDVVGSVLVPLLRARNLFAGQRTAETETSRVKFLTMVRGN